MNATKRWIYFFAVLITIPLGLATRKYPNVFPDLISTYGGDILYATMVFFLLRFLYPAKSLFKIAGYCYLFCFCIELQQLYRAAWIIKLRDTFPFNLVLGHDFLWSDCACYAVGTSLGYGIAYFIEVILESKNTY